MVYDPMVIFNDWAFSTFAQLLTIKRQSEDRGNCELVFILVIHNLRMIYNFFEISSGAFAGRRGR